MREHKTEEDWEDDGDDPDDSDQDDSVDTPTTECPYCGEEVADTAELCPHCRSFISREDAPTTQHPRWVVVTAIAIIVAILVVWVMKGW